MSSRTPSRKNDTLAKIKKVSTPSEAIVRSKAAKSAPVEPKNGTFWEYLAIARFDHATKHVFIIPGIIIAYALRQPSMNFAVFDICAGFVSAILIASANYVINEWLDRSFDAAHPVKSGRTAVNWKLRPELVYFEYTLLAVLGLFLAYLVGTAFFYTALLFVFSGIIYNVKPVRSKDWPYLDVISESINNPIRLTLGWTMIETSSLPPLSLLLGYWTAGAFLMTAKRLSEYRDISANQGEKQLQLYRSSFRFYTAENLTVSCFLYAMMSAFFIAIFLVRYRLEYILALPFIAFLFASYLWLSLREGSIAQRPERMFRSRRLVASLAAAVVVTIFVSFVDLPIVHRLFEPGFTPVYLQKVGE
ncbi:MAG: UbiA family prenyltransferase [Aestuariivirga sp.]